MERFRHVLYLERRLDGAGRGLRYAFDLAKRNSAMLTVGWAMCPTPGDRLAASGSAVRRHALADRAEARLRALAARVAADDPLVRFRILEGRDPVEAAVAAIDREGYDLVMTVAEGRPAAAPWRTRDLDRSLLRACPCPVWLLDPAQQRGPSVVVAGIDVSPERCSHLNREIISTATTIARAWDADLHLVHVWSLLGEGALSNSLAEMSATSLRHLRRRVREERRRSLQSLLDQVPEARGACVRMPPGDAFKVLMDTTHRLDGDVLVLGHSLRSGLPRLLFGNLSESLLGRIHASLVVLKATVRSTKGSHAQPAPAERQPMLVPTGGAG